MKYSIKPIDIDPLSGRGIGVRIRAQTAGEDYEHFLIDGCLYEREYLGPVRD